MAKSTQLSPRTLARLKADLKRVGVTYRQVAEEASKTSPRGHVGIHMVSHVLAGRAKSQNVVRTVRRLITQARDVDHLRRPQPDANGATAPLAIG